METEYLTKEKFNELTKELEHLKKIKRKEIAEHLEYARSLGDLSENAEYQEARGDQANVEDRITRLEILLKSAKITGAHGNEEVAVSSVVTVEKEKGNGPKTFIIVGSEEADISKNKVSNKSPFGQAILEKKKGETFSFNTPQGQVKYKILDIK